MSAPLRLFPVSASTIAGDVDGLTIGLLLVCGSMAIFIFALLVFFGARYRAGSPHSRKIDLSGEDRLEWTWTFATLGLFLGLFAWGSIVYFKMHLAPAGSYEVNVVGKQWMWKFEHPDGHRELNTLHVPVGKPVLLTMTSQDVIHSFFVPAFRTKQDVVPGRYTYLWFAASKVGTYHLFCTQYCGTMHAEMRGTIVAMSEDDFQKWLQTDLTPTLQAAQTTRAARGLKLFKTMGCMACHGNQATVHAPDLAGLYGTMVPLTNHTSVLADDNYLRESILNPRAKIVEGYQNIMPNFDGALNEEEVLDLIAYIKSLRTSTRSQLPSPRDISEGKSR